MKSTVIINGHEVCIALTDSNKIHEASIFAQKTEKYIPTPVFKNGNIGEFQGYVFVPERFHTWNERK
ncbi:MAG: hypothetical protein J6M07_07825 [Ruminococcus sp.]|nr:hypothetical protein [Ruminococcus sp.]